MQSYCKVTDLTLNVTLYSRDTLQLAYLLFNGVISSLLCNVTLLRRELCHRGDNSVTEEITLLQRR